MSLKKLYYDKNIKCCLTCIFIDEYTLAVNKGNGEVPQGYLTIDFLHHLFGKLVVNIRNVQKGNLYTWIFIIEKLIV